MTAATPTYATLDEWIAREALPLDLDSPATLGSAVDAVVAALGPVVDVLGFGEALHGGEEILLLRNLLFQRLVEAHGYSAIAIESSFPWSRHVNDYVLGRGTESYAAIEETGFSGGFGRLAANRELVEWMRRYNADPARHTRVHFYGFDSPGQARGPISPREEFTLVLDYLAANGIQGVQARRERIDGLLGAEARWANPMDWRDPVRAPALVADANALRIETEDLLVSLRMRRPELIARTTGAQFREAVHYATVAREHLNFYTVLAGEESFTGSLGVRDAAMADNLAYIVECERGRGKVLVFAHNSHLHRGETEMVVADVAYRWWSAGAQLDALFGSRYAVIGTGLGESAANGIGRPEPDTLEARLTATPGPIRFIPTHRGEGLPEAAVARLPSRSTGTRNPSYIAGLSGRSLTDFDWLAILDSATYSRGGPPLQ